MTKGELLDKLEEFEFRSNEIVGLILDLKDDYEDFHFDLSVLRRELEDDDNER